MAMSKSMWLREQERRKKQRQRRTRQKQLLAIVVLIAVIAAAVALVIIRRSDAVAPAPQSETADLSPLLLAPKYSTTLNADDINTSFFNNSAFLGNSVADNINKYNLLPSCDFYSSVTLDVDNVYTTVIGHSSTTAADHLKAKKFNKIFLSFGEREIESGNVYDFIDSYKSLVEKIKSYQTTAQIYLIAIPPVTKDASNAQSYGMTMGKINEYNEEIRSIASNLGVFYVNTPSVLGSAGGYLPDGVSADGINLSRDCAIELLSYISKSSHDPDQTDEDTDEENSESPSETASATSRPTEAPHSEEPEPTVNVLKDSAIRSTD